MFTMDDIAAIAYQCELQHTGPMEVAKLAQAVQYARSLQHGHLFMTGAVLRIAVLIDPVQNAQGYRNLPVSFANGSMNNMKHNTIAYAVDALLEAVLLDAIDADQFYQEFETIHPFADGNGRVGFVYWNMLRFWNRTEGNIAPALLQPPAYITR